MKAIRWLVLAATAGAVSPLPAQRAAEPRTLSIPAVLEVLGKAAAELPPGELTPVERRSFEAQTQWIRSVRVRLETLAVEAGVVTPRDAPTGRASGKRQHDPLVFKREVEALRETVIRESRRFTALSNMMKTRHDTVLNAIRNMRA